MGRGQAGEAVDSRAPRKASLEGMIVRTWSARATKNGAEAYSAYFEKTLLAQLRERDCFSGAFLLARDDDGLREPPEAEAD